MSSTIIGTDESPSPPLAHVTEHPNGRDEGEDTQEEEEEEHTKAPPQSVFPTSPPPPPPAAHVPLICLQSGLALKADPSHLKSWIALSLTLDGRDKLTKLGQYTSRLLAWYYESLARSLGDSILGGSDAMVARLLDKAAKFRGLQIKLTESRKAYRLGRSLVELDKIRSMGWGRFLSYHLRHLVVSEEEEDGEGGEMVVVMGSKKDERGGGEEDEDVAVNGTDGPTNSTGRTPRAHRAASNVGWGPVTTIATDGTSSTTTAHHEPEQDHTSSTSSNRRRSRPRLLLRRASTNIGWGPVTSEPLLPSSSASSSSRLYRSLSSIGQRIYRPLTSQLALSYSPGTDDVPSAPAWKIIGSTLKLVGLMGFWLGDNVNFLGSSGFLDDMNLTNKDDRARARGDLRRRAGHFAARAYFVGAVSGLYVNLREVLRHRGGTLRTAVERVHELEQKKKKRQQQSEKGKRNSWDMKDDEDDSVEDHPIGTSLGDIDSQLTAARTDLEKIKGKQFVLFVALLKVRMCMCTHLTSFSIIIMSDFLLLPLISSFHNHPPPP